MPSSAPLSPLAPAAEHLAQVWARINRACRDTGRAEADVELVCVSKNFDAAAIEPVLEAGQRIFGENRIQEAREKWVGLRRKFPDIELHLIGRLQSNKAADAVALFDVIETVDRPKIAEAIAQAIGKSGKSPRLLIQVNTGAEPQKAGIAPADLAALLAYCRQTAGLRIEGLMCIPPVDQLVSPHFALLRRLATDFGLSRLSMGMSDDFELAIQLGATQVRVGSAIFGSRRGVEKQPMSI
ncbi:YggS family pyridoxal phosphate-dependent enzyme [uncultured Rhodoblastus sp.]|uniref:YggS family pyridoxal phosphate-dependent enzyme n=1 Tax=uncultured Rhodoblastus sp. TaxID=543037 RepID=UPI0025D3F3F2|nr:YggS family pyridoxal phosphate-dependent enzyme [uncultured Rhodoblastus sp.]